MIATVFSGYGVMNLLHVVCAVLWVGGGAALGLLAWYAIRVGDPLQVAAIGRMVGWLGNRVFAPSSFVLLLLGIGMMINRDIPWDQAWIVFSLVVWGMGFLAGLLFFGPEGTRIEAMIKKNGPTDPEAQRRLRRLFFAARFDSLLLLLVVVAMAVKPRGGDVGVLVAAGAVLAVGIVLASRPARAAGRPERRSGQPAEEAAG